MASEVTNYQCPACTGPLHFDGSIGKLKCDYCDSEYTIEEIEKLYGAQNAAAVQATQQVAQEPQIPPGGWDESDLNDDWGADAEKLNAYNCTTCGAELICESSTAATMCPYCGNPTIIPGKLSNALKPDFVIPFKVTKKQAEDALRKYYGGKTLLPKVFAKENHIQEVQGMYVPFWLYDGRVVADLRYSAELTQCHRTSREEITETLYYQLVRKGAVDFEKIPVDGSKRMDDALMDSIEPFDYSELKPFSLSYLPGYLADRYDMSAQECTARADDRATNTAQQAMDSTTTGFGSVVLTHKNMRLKRGKVQYALLPVWILNTKWNGQQYTFAMNGQTGKLVGDLPMDKGLYWKWRLILTVGIGAVLYAINWLIALL
ncbi:MAG: hypothetical protein MJ077_09675 [Oscillospiraceae bacterium]|nr:hypothetical protein [Oscillospiraceae bacterium]